MGLRRSAAVAAGLVLAALPAGCGEYDVPSGAGALHVEREAPPGVVQVAAAGAQTGGAEHSRPDAGYTYIHDAESFIEDFKNMAFVVLWDHNFSGENNRDLARLYNERGMAHMDLGKPEHALDDYDEAISIYPMLVEAYLNRAEVRALLGMDAEAEQDLLRAEQLGAEAGLIESGR